MTLVDILLWVLTVIVLLPLTVLIIELLAAVFLPGRSVANDGATRTACAILVPAHNEESGISRTIHALQTQLEPDDKLIVVADNCNDGTAEVARAAGATVIERQDPTRRGKGYALDFGVRHLESDPREVVVIVDADCIVEPGSIAALVRDGVHHPVQAIYLMALPAESGPKQQISAFAFRIKNLVRPLGMHRLGFPCLLTGTGMAFPWRVLSQVPLASGNIVEDMQMGIDLALAGSEPRLCPQARVNGELPASGTSAAVKQRTRWEHGHIKTLLSQVPRLLWAGTLRLRPSLLGLGLELSIPPLALLGLSWAIVFAMTALGWWLGARPEPFFLLAGVAGVALLAMILAWIRFGRDCLPFTSLLAIPFYVFWKVPIYIAFLFRPQKAWVRTERTSDPPKN